MSLRRAVRSLARSPGFTAVAVLTLALGIGSTTTIFSVVDTVMLRPLPFPEPQRLVRVWETTPRGTDFSASDPNYLDFRDRSRSFEALAAFKQAPLSLTGSGEPRRVAGIATTHELFGLLGARPLLGRTFLPEEDVAGAEARVAVLSHALWVESFAGAPDLIGTSILLDREPHTVIGVMPPGYEFPAADLWIPLAPDPARERDDHWLEIVGRLRPGVDIEAATTELRAIARSNGERFPAIAGWSVRVEPFHDWLVGARFRQTMLVLLCGVGSLLLIGCLNLANLLLARATERQTEIAISAALGAGRPRIVLQLLGENLLLALLGTALGLWGAAWAIDLLQALAPAGVPRLAEITVDGRVASFSLLLALGTTLVFGLAPALHASRIELAQTLRGARSQSPTQRRTRDLLVVAQIALATVLVVGAGLLIRSFVRLQAADTGFEAARLAAVPIHFDPASYAEDWRRVVTLEEILERLRALPGVEAAGATAVDPLSGWNLANDVTPVERAVEVGRSGLLQAGWRAVTPGFFRTMGLPVLRGRTFVEGDPADGPRLAVLSETLAEQLWPGQDAVGRRLYWGGIDGDPMTVIGVVGDYRDVEIDAAAPPLLFLAHRQLPWPSMTIMLRSRGELATVTAAVREQIHAVDPLLPVLEVRPLERSVASAVAGPRFRSLLLGAFALAALLLAAMGVYGVTAFGAARRSREFGVRLALGASPGEVTRMVLRSGLILAAAGLGLGIAGAWGLSRLVASLLYEVSPTDPTTFLAAVLILGGAAVLASYLPGRRAGRLDPVAALREQ